MEMIGFIRMMFVYEKGLMSGISATTFAPNTNITRAQIAVIFYRMAGSLSLRERTTLRMLSTVPAP